MAVAMSNTQESAGVLPWHAGELALQRSAGVQEKMDGVGRRNIRPFLLEQHREFFPLLPYVALGVVDPEGNAWATMRTGRPGFLHAPTPLRLDVAASCDAADPAERGMADGMAIGLLGIDMATRRRNRLNGTIRNRQKSGFEIEVLHSYGNCPRYIQHRDYEFVREPTTATEIPALVSDGLDARARGLISGADSFFVASYVEQNGIKQVDVSHRGGQSGFIRIANDGTLTVPDFSGNLFFNTLGNILLNPKTGLLFVDYETGDVLQLTGDAEVILDSPEIAAFKGAERLWRFRPKKVYFRAEALPLRWAFRHEGWSPSSLLTGSWREAEMNMGAKALEDRWRTFRVGRLVDESASVRSVYLEPTDGFGLAPYDAGQHLPIRVLPARAPSTAVRTYTLSTAPSDGQYRISVKRDGLVSRHLHGLEIGDLVEVRAPAGSFTIGKHRRPLVLLAAGVGITPLLSMLRHVVFEIKRTGNKREVVLFQSARSKGEFAFATEIAELVAQAPNAVRWIRLLGHPDGAVEGVDYDSVGRIDMQLLRSSLSFGDYEFYVCGPPSFSQAMYDGLRELNVADDRIHAEAFGPASLRREAGSASPPSLPAPAEGSVEVEFTRSGLQATWKPGGESLLELAENAGLSPAFGCRSGNCGECSIRVTHGNFTYRTKPTAEIIPGEALICCAVPTATPDGRANAVGVAL
jgi:ferredoxin-NADP reductase/predicted pyridoxine 5'-phosphate oxidase superfamily flavin-nucleotide-binding protein